MAASSAALGAGTRWLPAASSTLAGRRWARKGRWSSVERVAAGLSRRRGARDSGAGACRRTTVRSPTCRTGTAPRWAVARAPRCRRPRGSRPRCAARAAHPGPPPRGRPERGAAERSSTHRAVATPWALGERFAAPWASMSEYRRGEGGDVLSMTHDAHGSRMPLPTARGPLTQALLAVLRGAPEAAARDPGRPHPRSSPRGRPGRRRGPAGAHDALRAALPRPAGR